MDVPMTIGLRWLCLLFIGACLAVVVESQEQNVRLLAVVGIVIFGQAREMLLLAHLPKAEKGKKA